MIVNSASFQARCIEIIHPMNKRETDLGEAHEY
jgi:hypothetical protein